MPAEPWDKLETELRAGRFTEAFATLTETLRAQGQYHELFDARLMQARQSLGLPPLLHSKLEEAPEPQRTQLEEKYVAACREVGGLLLAEGKYREAWLYLRPADGRAEMKAALQTAADTEENVEDLIDLSLREGLHPQRGFELLVKHYGVCDGISTFESQLGRFPLADQQAAAAHLVRELHRELIDNLRNEIERQAGQRPTETTIAGLVERRDWLFAERGYHIDTTHLAAVVRFARQCEQADVLRLALDLTEYGRRLDEQYQFDGEEPFGPDYAKYALFFQALLGENVEPALAYFKEKASTTSFEEHGPQAAEVYVSLLSRLKRNTEALAAAQELLPDEAPRVGIAPSLFELARRADDFQAVLEQSRRRQDLVGFAAGLLAERERAKQS